MNPTAQKCTLYATALLAISARAAAGDDPPPNPAAAQEMPQVVIIGNAPLPGVGLPLNQVAGDVQTAGAADLKRQQTLGITDFLNNNMAGISIAESQDNPLQADINYHGFTASPLLGTPQGLSVYVDGVRVNEAFGDTVNWDLIPDIAIANLTLAGANPVYGLNTLGGALTVQTKSGHDFPGTELSASGGSFGRHQFTGATGGSSGKFDYFVAANFLQEDGWRDFSPTQAKQAFAKFGWQDEKTDIDLSYTYADNAMVGNGAVPESMLAVRRQAVYSVPDFTNNRLSFVNLTGSHFLMSDLVVSGNVYYRDLITVANNGDVNDNNYMSDDYNGQDIDCGGTLGSHTDFAFCTNGINRTSRVDQHTFGVGIQVTDTHDLAGHKNQLVVGASFDHATDDYLQRFQYGELTPWRSVAVIDNPGNPDQIVNSVSGGSKTTGIYLTDTLSPNDLVHITASARYNRIDESLGGFSVDTDVADDDFDGLEPLSGRHTYTRVNPFIGATFTPSKDLTLFANYNEGSRAPTIIELGCSDPDRPCGLPNDFASDPDLKQVISKTFEIGGRGPVDDGALQWNIDLFRTDSRDDIQFVATSTTEGYFSNVGSTRRQGLDLGVGGKIIEGLRWRFVYSFVDATYRSSFLVNAGSNSTADENGNTQVSPGARIPLIPRHTGRLRLDYSLGRTWDVGATLIVSSGVFLHGDENNQNVPDGGNFIGTGQIGGYGVVNLDTTWHVTRQIDVFARVVNLFDKHYATAGFLTSNSFDPNGTFRPDPDDWTNENSVSPGTPVAVWAGVRVHFGE